MPNARSSAPPATAKVESRAFKLLVIVWQGGGETSVDTEHGSKYADEQGVAEEETLKKGMEAKSKQFQEKGCGPLRKGVAFLPDK